MNSEQPASTGILLVDDTVENLRLLSDILSTRGYDVRPVTSGRDALRAVALEPPDLVLLDVAMPEMSGFQVCAELKSQPAWRDIPVIFLTASTEVSDKLKGFAVGGADYVTKPFHVEEVLARVSHQLELHDARRSRASQLARLQELERLRDDLVHMVVHDMRAPLSAMIMSLELLGLQLKAEHRATLDYTLEGARRLNDMATTLLDVSRLEAGKLPLSLSTCDLTRLVSEAIDGLAALDPTRRIEMEPRGPLLVTCDPSLIRRVLENLISNGIKHTPAGTRLQIDVGERGGRGRVTVRDEGPGVPPESRARIFQKFGASPAQRDKPQHSVGLGLAFCRLAVEAHAGSIGVDSGPSPGSCFWFEIPR